MKIYTKTGDNGETSLIGGSRVPKYHKQVEAYGCLDELNSYLGLIRDLCETDEDKELILNIQEHLFIAASLVASDSKNTMDKMPQLQESDILFLEESIDMINKTLPELKLFILPGGHFLASHTHIARTICRKAERLTLKAGIENEKALRYLNRLSDFLFVLARKYAHDLGDGDVVYKVKK